MMRYAAIGEDVEVLCPKCKSPLVIALSREKAAALSVHPGIYCPKSRGHVYRLVTLANDTEQPDARWLDKLRDE